MLKTLKGILKGNKIILEEPIPPLDEQNILLTLLDKPTTEEKQLILAGIQKGLQDKENKNTLTFEESFESLEKLVEL